MAAEYTRIFRVALISSLILPGATFAQTQSVTEAVAYHDDTTLWVMGQIRSKTCMSSVPANLACDGGPDSVTGATEYGWKALPWKVSEFGLLKQTLAYDSTSPVESGQLGSLRARTGGNGSTVTFANWKRGTAQTIRFPATPEAPAGATRSAVVDNNGWILSVTDESGARTCYEYDQMGRINRIRYPSEVLGSADCDDSTWAETRIEFRPMTSAEWRPPGVEAGQWRQYTATANYEKIVYLDALFRPVLAHEYDAVNTSGTLRAVSTTYDAAGRVAFQSYPSNDLIPAATGIWTFYDGLGRTKEVRQDSEQGQLITKTDYIGTQTRVTGPDGEVTLTTFQAFDQPSFDAPVRVEEPLGRTTMIVRDPHGKPVEIERKL